mgnify:CR=1 FL=1
MARWGIVVFFFLFVASRVIDVGLVGAAGGPGVTAPAKPGASQLLRSRAQPKKPRFMFAAVGSMIAQVPVG